MAISTSALIVVAATCFWFLRRGPRTAFEFLREYDPVISKAENGYLTPGEIKAMGNPHAILYMFDADPSRIINRMKGELAANKGWQVEDLMAGAYSFRNYPVGKVALFGLGVPRPFISQWPTRKVTCYVVTLERRTAP